MKSTHSLSANITEITAVLFFFFSFLTCVSRRSAHNLLKHDIVLQTETPPPFRTESKTGTRYSKPRRHQIRNHQGRLTHTLKCYHKCKKRRTLMCQRQWQRRHETQTTRLKECKTRPKIATWNCRGLKVDTITPTGELKLKCLINRMLIQHWGCIVLTDTQGPDTIREFSYHGRQWTIELHFC